MNFSLLGYSFVPSYQKGIRGKYQLVVSRKSWDKLKAELKAITRKTTPMSFDERIQRLNRLIRGWVNYFKLASTQMKLKKLDEWIRKRLRCCIWHAWKKPERKRKNLIRLGVNQNMAYAWSRSRRGNWAIAQSPILGSTITVARLKSRGVMSMQDDHQQIRSGLMKRRIREPNVRWCESLTLSELGRAGYSITTMCFFLSQFEATLSTILFSVVSNFFLICSPFGCIVI